jgi:hypothetical protein
MTVDDGKSMMSQFTAQPILAISMILGMLSSGAPLNSQLIRVRNLSYKGFHCDNLIHQADGWRRR